MYKYRFFIDYPIWRAQFERDIWHEPYHVQQVRLFMFELFLAAIGQSLAPTMTLDLVKTGVGTFHQYVLTDQARFIATQWPSIVFWFGESGFWESDINEGLHKQRVQDYLHTFITRYESHDRRSSYAAQYALLLMEHGLPADQLASPVAWEMLSHTIHGGMGEDWAHEFYDPPHLMMQGHMFHNWRVALPQSPFLYPPHIHGPHEYGRSS